MQRRGHAVSSDIALTAQQLVAHQFTDLISFFEGSFISHCFALRFALPSFFAAVVSDSIKFGSGK